MQAEAGRCRRPCHCYGRSYFRFLAAGGPSRRKLSSRVAPGKRRAGGSRSDAGRLLASDPKILGIQRAHEEEGARVAAPRPCGIKKRSRNFLSASPNWSLFGGGSVTKCTLEACVGASQQHNKLSTSCAGQRTLVHEVRCAAHSFEWEANPESVFNA